MGSELVLPDLEERFLPPESWKSDTFFNPDTDHVIHYNYMTSPSNTKGTIVVLPGLSEFGEKYIETAKHLAEQGYDLYVIDWAYQGRSSRLKENPYKRHSDGYETDISDLHYLVGNIIGSDKPLYMIGHSMGGNIGLRYTLKYSDVFKAAAFSAPMFGIKALKFFPWPVRTFLATSLPFIGSNYIPGGKDWHEREMSANGDNVFSRDLKRNDVHDAWCKANPKLQIGSPTFKWLYESLLSIDHLNRTSDQSETPILLAIADEDDLVDNEAIHLLGKKIKNSRVIEFKNAKHEILMETDDIRNRFLAETLKTFSL